MKTASQILLLIVLTSCLGNEPSKEFLETEREAVKEIEERKIEPSPTLEYSTENIKIKFSELTDPFDLGLYQKLQVLLNDSVQVELNSKTLELEGLSFDFDQDHVYKNGDQTIFIVEVNNRPEPSYFLVFEKTKNQITQLGQTEPLTKDFFGDIDNDMKLEIGGFNSACQGRTEEDFNQPDFCLDHFRIYEVDSSIYRDNKTEEKEKNNMRQQRL